MCLALLFATSLLLRAEPSRLVLGERDRVELRIQADGASEGPLPELWASVGSISGVRRLSGGVFAATWRPPPERYPQVALLLATLGQGAAAQRAWLSLPLLSDEPLSLATKPNSEAELLVGGHKFGPVHTDESGRARIRARLPPEVSTATVRVRDPFGNVNESVIDLRPPPFRRLHMVASSPSASWSDPRPVLLEIFAVTQAGRPAALKDLRVAAEGGQLGPKVAVAPGIFRVEFRASAQASGSARIRARLAGDAAVETLAIALGAGPPSSVRLRATPSQIAGAGDVALEATLVDARGNPLPGEVSFSAEGAVATPSGPRSAVLHVAAAHGGLRSITVRAHAGEVEGTVAIALRAGPPARAAIALGQPLREGESSEATVELSDEAGNPVEGAPLEVAAEGATAGRAWEIAQGRYAVPLRAAFGSSPGPAWVRVRSGGASSEVRFAVLPPPRSELISAGFLFGGRTNFSRARAAGFEAEGAARTGLGSVEVLGRVGLLQFASSRTPLVAPDVLQRNDLRALSFAMGARVELPLPRDFALHAALLGGVLRTFGSLQIVGGAADGARQGISSWGPLAAAVAGTSLRAGRGRAVAELQLTAAPGRGDVAGNLGGLGLSFGYLLALR